MDTTTSFNFSLLNQNQAMKEIVINEAVTKIDSLLHNSIISEVSKLPGVSNNRDLYLLKTQSTDALARYNNHLALYNNSKWEFIRPKAGMFFFLASDNKFIIFKDNDWRLINDSGVKK